MGMRLRVLGHAGPYPGPGQATSGYLLEAEGRGLLLDCGSGVLSRLGRHLSRDRLEAVVLSHLHYDHFVDLLVLRYALESDMKRGLRRKPLPVYLPPGREEERGFLELGEVFDLRLIDPDEPVLAGPFSLRFVRTTHAVPCYGVAVDGGRFGYTADTGWSEELVAFFTGTRFLLCEAALQEADHDLRIAGHLTAREAGELARQAEVGRVLLTHFPPYYDLARTLREAAESFPEAELSVEEAVYEL